MQQSLSANLSIIKNCLKYNKKNLQDRKCLFLFVVEKILLLNKLLPVNLKKKKIDDLYLMLKVIIKKK